MEEFVAVIIIPLSLLIIACAIFLCVWSVLRSLKINKRKKTDNGVPVSMIGWLTFMALLLISIPCILLLSFTDGILITAGCIMAIAVGSLVYSILHSGHLRKFS